MCSASTMLKRALSRIWSSKGNLARANQWQQSGGYIRMERGCPQCGGWYLKRRDEGAGITLHFNGCLRSDLSLFENMMGWGDIIEYYERFENIRVKS